MPSNHTRNVDDLLWQQGFLLRKVDNKYIIGRFDTDYVFQNQKIIKAIIDGEMPINLAIAALSKESGCPAYDGSVDW